MGVDGSEEGKLLVGGSCTDVGDGSPCVRRRRAAVVNAGT